MTTVELSHVATLTNYTSGLKMTVRATATAPLLVTLEIDPLAE
jgi:hypothetical protein